MDSIQNILTFFRHEGFTITFGEAVLLLSVTSVCILYRQFKIGLLISYCFFIYWGYIENYDFFKNMFGSMTSGMIIYYLVGILLVVIGIVGFFGHIRD